MKFHKRVISSPFLWKARVSPSLSERITKAQWR
jgi:hypothetical protein